MRGKRKFLSQYEKNVYQFNQSQGVMLIYEPAEIQYQAIYVPDFLLITRTGKQIYIETKGRLRDTDKNKLIQVKDFNPSLDLRLLFQNSKVKLNPKKPRSHNYAWWAEKHGFKWSEGLEVPHAWINE